MINPAGEGLGQRAERHVHERLRAALPPEYTMLANVAWLVRDHGVEREGEADLVIAHPELGFLTVEVKAGADPARQPGALVGRRRPARSVAVPAGGRQPPQPGRQAARSCPAWEAGLDPIAGHAVAFPNVDLASLDPRRS